MHHTFDHLSVWELAHRWHDIDPNLTTSETLSLSVQDTIRLISRALVNCEIAVFNSNGIQKKNPLDCPALSDYKPDGIWRERREGDPAPSSDDPIPDWNPNEDDSRSLIYVSPDRLQEDEIEDQYYDFQERWGSAHYKLVDGLEKTYKDREYDKTLLEKVHVDRSGILTLCELTEIEPPRFWFNKDELVSLRRAINIGRSTNKQHLDSPNQDDDAEHRTSTDSFTGQDGWGALKRDAIDLFWGQLNEKQKARLLCREIAKKLWEADPRINIKDITENEHLLEFGGGKYYQGKNTLRDWVKDLDPRDESEKIGRPKSSPKPKPESI